MTTTRAFRCEDLFKFNNVNLDPLTETYNCSFYYQYLATWPEYFLIQESPSGRTMGYIMGKSEGKGELWHGHVTAVTVAPEFRRLGLARQLMDQLEDTSMNLYNAYFVDLFVRISNALAISMYRQFGYEVYRQVLGYYSSEEDAYDMRKSLPRDPERRAMTPLKHPVRPEDLEW
mmetsp:Transcript_9295/g.19658  ORF Transcript_9295/g.19658 Transcript_9295/m.19658 type:complete len:174 (-) Transcript_9295:196-717(-)